MSRRLLLRLRRERGFTLVELLITIVLLVILMTIFSMVFAATVHHTNEVQEENVLQTEVRGSIDRLAQDLRTASVGDASTPIEAMTANTIQFLSPDRASTYHMRRIAYRLSGTTLERASAISSNTGGPSWTIPALGSYIKQVKSVKNTTLFTYLDENGAVTATASAVHTVTVSISVAPSTAQGRTFIYATSATIRTTQ